MQQNAKTHWVYEWPLRRKAKWPVKKLLARRQQRLLRRWLRYVKSLRDEEEMVHVCEPEAGRNLSDDGEERSSRDLIDCQVGRDGIFKFPRWEIERDQVKVSYTARREVLKVQVARRAMRWDRLEDLIDCQVGSRGNPIFPGGQGERDETM
jgi:hypothetical protein